MEGNIRIITKEADLPLEFWNEAVEYDIYIRNRINTRLVIEGSVISPEEAFSRKILLIDQIRV